MPEPSYLRCRHCRGFYELEFSRCKWCDYDTPLLDADGSPKGFPNRETCRAIQIAEFEQLPAEALDDCMKPPPEYPDLKCACLRCGQDGHLFEAIEMRWLTNENMWACPCTTCGGRGFQFDIHPIESRWQCVECGHFYAPPDGNYKAGDAECPRCGCKEANGWFDDEDDEFDEEFDDSAGSEGAVDDSELDGLPPWDAENEEAPEFDTGVHWAPPEPQDLSEGRIPDDIDFPRHFSRESDGGAGGATSGDDIPF